MCHPDDEHGENVVGDRIHDSVRTLPHTVTIRVSGQLFTTYRMWVFGQLTNPGDDLPPHFYRFDFFDFLGGGGFEPNPITCHCASTI